MPESAVPTENNVLAPPPPAYLAAAVEALIESCDVQMGVALTPETPDGGADRTDRLLGAAIDLKTGNGAWRLYVFCPGATAGRLARIMFDLPDDEAPEAEDLEDCLCEVVNIAAGHLKSLNDELASFELHLPGFIVPGELPEELELDAKDRARRLCGGDDIELLTTFVWHEET